MTSLARLQAWYFSQCNGDWEHSFGIGISTLDNPGWSVDINLNETSLEGREFQPLRIQRSENDWLFVSINQMKFKIDCGPSNLEEGLGLFCDWADSSPAKEQVG
ncbi:MAG: immunity 53 family protein [Terracidiphilus sp.]|jgi:hypothetical protein